jgi:hypothetical protein
MVCEEEERSTAFAGRPPPKLAEKRRNSTLESVI